MFLGRQSSYQDWNLLLINFDNNKLIDNLLQESTKSNSFPISIFYAFILGFAPISIFALISKILLGRYINKNFSKAIKLALESFIPGQKYVQN